MPETPRPGAESNVEADKARYNCAAFMRTVYLARRKWAMQAGQGALPRSEVVFNHAFALEIAALSGPSVGPNDSLLPALLPSKALVSRYASVIWWKEEQEQEEMEWVRTHREAEEEEERAVAMGAGPSSSTTSASGQ